MSHESLDRIDDQAERPSDRSVGYVFAVVFAVIALFPLAFGRPPRWWASGLSLAFVGIARLSPRMLAPLNRVWMKFGALLHRIVSPIVLSVLFFVFVTPTGILMRALGKDPLRLRKSVSAASYWIERRPPGPSPESLRDQF